MAYTVSPDDLQIPAGGLAQLTELADQNLDGNIDAAVVLAAQAEADSWIDGYARRLFGAILPFGTVAPALTVPPAIKALAAAETVYRLKCYRRVDTPQDHTLRLEREATMQALEAGRWDPTVESYPIRGGAGTPVATDCVAPVDGFPSSDFGRDGLKGFW